MTDELTAQARCIASRSGSRVDRNRDQLFEDYLMACGGLADSVRRTIAADDSVRFEPLPVPEHLRHALADYTQTLRTLHRYDMGVEPALQRAGRSGRRNTDEGDDEK